MKPLICKDDDKPVDQLKVEQTNETYFYDESSDNVLTTERLFTDKQISTDSDVAAICKVDQIYTNSVTQGFFIKAIIANKQISTISDTADICRVDKIYTNSITPRFFMEGIIVKKRISTISDAAAICSHLPCVVTGYECPVTVGHRTNSSKTIATEYHKDSGDIGAFKAFKTAFQNSADFFSPKNGMVGWQNAHYMKQKH